MPSSVPGPCEPEDLIDGIIFAANYLGSTQLLSERNPSKNIRMMQAQEAVSRVKVLVGSAGRWFGQVSNTNGVWREGWGVVRGDAPSGQDRVCGCCQPLGAEKACWAPRLSSLSPDLLHGGTGTRGHGGLEKRTQHPGPSRSTPQPCFSVQEPGASLRFPASGITPSRLTPPDPGGCS